MNSIITQASSFASEIDSLIILIAVLVGFWLIIVEALLFYMLVRFRKKNNLKAAYITGEDHKHNKWIHWAHYAVILCDIIVIFFAVKAWYNVKQQLPVADETIRIEGQQWNWKFTLPGPDGELDTPDDIRTVDHLYVQVNRTYHFKLRSNDVMHSFSVPVFRLKQDAVPGREITGWFKPTKTGKYDIQCAEMCGIGHGIMNGVIHIQSPLEHQTWLQQNKADLTGSRQTTKNETEVEKI